jgi:phospholipase/carboxylesterase
METDLLTFEGWNLRLREPGSGRSGRILLLLHGWTGDENSMWIFTRNFPRDGWLLAPRAPYPAREGGYSWRAPSAPGGWPSVENMSASVDALLGLVEQWSRTHEITAPQLDVAGFSQGGALAFLLAALHPARVRKAAILAGFPPQGVDSLLSPGLFSGKHFFAAHGSRDKIVPVEMARLGVKMLQDSGAQVTYCESEVGHKLSAECLKSLESYLAD